MQRKTDHNAWSKRKSILVSQSVWPKTQKFAIKWNHRTLAPHTQGSDYVPRKEQLATQIANDIVRFAFGIQRGHQNNSSGIGVRYRAVSPRRIFQQQHSISTTIGFRERVNRINAWNPTGTYSTSWHIEIFRFQGPKKFVACIRTQRYSSPSTSTTVQWPVLNPIKTGQTLQTNHQRESSQRFNRSTETSVHRNATGHKSNRPTIQFKFINKHNSAKHIQQYTEDDQIGQTNQTSRSLCHVKSRGEYCGDQATPEIWSDDSRTRTFTHTPVAFHTSLH